MFVKTTCLIAGIVMTCSAPVSAADFSDPTWPCIQRKVGELSLGLMWPHTVPDRPMRDALKSPADELIDALVLRRVSLDEVTKLIHGFVASTPDLSTDDLGLIFADVFKRINTERNQLIEGISRYSLTQIDLAARIDAARVEMDTLMAQEEQDFERVDTLEEQLDWDQRIFRDRAQSLTYVCETPILLEKRAYAISTALLQHVTE